MPSLPGSDSARSDVLDALPRNNLSHREVDSPDHKVFVVKIHELPTETIEDRAYDTTSPIDVL